ncbi:MAG: glycogen/starch synthase [Planctomycetes bacterium]|nr:glycogen/starch synthase [Planctomycetota bacterium]
MDSLTSVHIDEKGKCDVRGPGLSQILGPNQTRFFTSTLNQTLSHLSSFATDRYRDLLGRTLNVRLVESLDELVRLAPQEILLDRDLLSFDPDQKDVRRLFLIGLLERTLFHATRPDAHIGEVMHHSLRFLAGQACICAATLEECERRKENGELRLWSEVLSHRHEILLLERFWTWVGCHAFGACTLLRRVRNDPLHVKRKIKDDVGRLQTQFEKEHSLSREVVAPVTRFSVFVPDTESIVFIYALGRTTRKCIRICRSRFLDAMASPAACHAITHGDTRTEIFYDHGRFIRPYLERVKLYQKDPPLLSLAQNLTSSDVSTAQAAIDALVEKIHSKDNAEESIRLLYAGLYYWFNPDRGMSRSICLRVSKILEDLLTERPTSFPASRINRCVLRTEMARVQVTVHKRPRINAGHVRARMQWSINGHRKRPVMMEPVKQGSKGSRIVFRGEFPARKGWIHYSVQISEDQGKSWKSEVSDKASNGLLKFIPDERGERILSFYADTFNLSLDDQQRPLRDDRGRYVYGTFQTIAEQLAGIKAEGYTRIYPLGALELGWPGEAGPDPSVFSVSDGWTVRRDMGGIEGLLGLRAEADRLGMKVILCALSHFSRARQDYPYHFPAYILEDDHRLTRRAGWDGEWDQWYDSFMVNMRDFANVQRLARIAEELAALGFGLRIDVGHGYDTVFPVHPDLSGTARLFGEVTVPGFEPVDLRGSSQPNIPLLYLHYRTQKKNAAVPVVYVEQWHGNEARMLQSGAVPYNSLIKNLENIRTGESIHEALGLNDNLRYLGRVINEFGGQTISLFNSHDEEAPASNYQNMIWPAAAFLVFSSYGPLMYHISRLPGEEAGSLRERFDQAYLECWKHWVNNRFQHPWPGEFGAKREIMDRYPLLAGFGLYLRGLFAFADEHTALTKGTLTPIETHNGRIAAFLRTHGGQSFLCVFNFPNPHHEGQQAVAREFNFTFKQAATGDLPDEIQSDLIYEIRERYNNAEGRRGRGERSYWSGEELVHLGFGGVLSPVSSHVYELINRDHAVDEPPVLIDSFLRYFRYGKTDRVRHSYIGSAFRQASQPGKTRLRRFIELFVTVVTWIDKKRKLGIADLATVLAEISEEDAHQREVIIDYLMRIAVRKSRQVEIRVRLAAADILHSINIGTIAMVSPESKFSGSSGGVGLYTTDMADVLSEMGFHVVIVTPLYECNRNHIFSQFAPKYEGHSYTVTFPRFDEHNRSIHPGESSDVVNFLRAKLNRISHGKRSRVEVIYLENGTYFDRPYGGETAEDKLRRARLFAQSALEALRAFNYYPTIIQTNEWPTWLIPAYLRHQVTFRDDPHFKGTETLSMMHNPHPAYSIVLAETDPLKWSYYCAVLDFDRTMQFALLLDPDSQTGRDIDLTHIMLKTSAFIGTVSRAMRQRILDEPWLFGHAHLFREKAETGRFFGKRNGFNMAARQRFWFGSKKSLLETYSPAASKRLFLKYTRIKQTAKAHLQEDPHIRLRPDKQGQHHIIFGMLHRICRQKGFELLVDWKVYPREGHLDFHCEAWNMRGSTLLEHFLSTNEEVQFVICGRVEDSGDGRRFDAHLQRIAQRPDFQGRFAYFPEGTLPPSLYRNLYLGSQFFVMPSGGDIGEPCGISQQEAHAGGTPVIAHHQDGLTRTVTDRDFGDMGEATDGIKFQGFTGNSLLAALQDAVSIYRHGSRGLYRDEAGRPVKLAYAELSFNAFRRDHRWLRLLHDYVTMYAQIHGLALPDHLDAVQLIVEFDAVSDRSPADAILRKGLLLPDAIRKLVIALSSEAASVRRGAAHALMRLHAMKHFKEKQVIQDQLEAASRSPQGRLSAAARGCLTQMNR